VCYMWWEVEGGGPITINYRHYSLTWVFLPFVHVVFVSCVLLLVLSCLVCNCCWLAVCVIAVVLCVLSSCVYLLYYVCIPVFHFKSRTAG